MGSVNATAMNITMATVSDHEPSFLMGSLGSRWRSIAHSYHDIMEHHADKRVKNWFLMSGPMPTAVACAIYLVCMKIIGPRIMRNRKPYDLTRVMIFYNLFQMLFNAWILSLGLGHWFTEYSIFCQPVDYSDKPGAVEMVTAAWWFFFSKFIDWFDTLFFVMRKKFQHLSLLHLVHHGLMPFSIWWGVKFCGGGQSTFFGLLNTQVHVIMYLYYSLAALGPRYQKYLWWKKYLTTIQLLQFLAVLIHSCQLLFNDCNYPRVFVYAIIAHALLFIGLFTDFYIKTYVKKPKVKVDDDSGATKQNGSANGHVKEQNGVHQRKNKAVENGKQKGVNGHNGMCIQQAFYDEQ